jgi:D-glycero-D-manno-heptose 1,7-bisphosphate phosphatase
LRTGGEGDLRQLKQPGAVFLDRDGTINAKPEEGSYVVRPDQLELLPHAGMAIRRLNDARLKVLVVTNQRGIALGRLSEEMLARIHARLSRMLVADCGAHVDGFFHCPHQIGVCDCRKPRLGMFRSALRRWPEIDPTCSAMVGDSSSDVEAGVALGMTSLLIGDDVPDLASAVEHLLGGPADRAASSPVGTGVRAGGAASVDQATAGMHHAQART